jgi:hypothetical protein
LNQIEAKMQNLRKNKENIKRKGREKGKKNRKWPGETFPAQSRSQPVAHPGIPNWYAPYSLPR